MFHQYSHDSENASDILYAESSISSASVPVVDCPILQTLPTAHLHRSLKSSRDTSPFPIPGQPSPPPSRFSPYVSSTPSLSRPESRPKSLESGHVVCRGKSADPSSPSEKGSRHHPSQSPDALNPLHVRDPEKGLVDYAESPLRDSQLYRRTYICTSDEMYGENSCAKGNAVWILIYLSILSPLLTLLIAIYTVLATLLLLLLAPLSLCTSYASLSVKLHAFLSPPINFQLHLICSPINVSDPTMSNTPMLIPLNLLAPIYAAGIALSAWVAAAFWFYAAILGDPEGGDGRDDGRAAVLGVSGWWERWLERGGRTTVLEGG